MPDEPRVDKTLALHVQQQFNGICDRFEAAWKEGARPRIEAYLMESTGLPRAELLRELLLVELTYRCRLHERPVATEYDQRFALDAALIRAVFRELRAPDGPLSDVILFDETVFHRGAGRNASPPAGDETAAAGTAPLRFGRYVVTERLGEGGFGVVYRGHDTELRRDVAIKVARRGRIATPADAESYLAEARMVANLDHPHIVPVYDVGSTDEFPCYVVSKYIEGADLAATLKQARLSCAQSAELVATVAEALHYAHKQGLVHRDVKPGNILLDKSGRPFVVDFGLALREQDFAKGAPMSAGTPAYMSPEQARGEGHRVDGRSDIFSLGVVFYEMLVGRKPFTGDSPEVLLEQIATCEPRPPRQYDESTPKELERICLKALAKRAADRHTTAFDLADDLRHWLAQRAAEEGRRGRNEKGIQETVSNPRSAIRDPQSATTPTTDRSRSFPRVCARSTSTTPTSSWNSCPGPVTGTVCPTVFASGKPRSKKPMPTRPSWWA